jgi:hypothetical protein
VSKYLRIAVAIVAGLIVWVVVATLGNFLLRVAIPNYRAEEAAMSFSLIAQLARLALGLVSTAATAATSVILSRGKIGTAVAAGCILLALFIPVHISLWSRFPAWYHLFFLASLPLGAVVFARLAASMRSAA